MASTPPPSANASQISLKIMSPSPGVPADLAYTVDGNTTINALKLLIKASLESNPTLEQQRVIYRGKILDGSCTVKDALIGDQQQVHTLHLVVSPPPHVSTAQTTTAAFRPQAQAQEPTRILPSTSSRPPVPAHIANNPLLRPFTGLVPGLDRGPMSMGELRQTVRAQTEILERLRAERAALNAGGSGSVSFGVSSGVSLPGAQARVPASGTRPLGGEPSTSFTAPASASPTIPTLEQPAANLDAPLHSVNPTANTPLSPRPDTSARRRELLAELRQLDQEEGLATAPLHISQRAIPSSSAVFLLQDRLGRPHSLLVGPVGSAQAPPRYFSNHLPPAIPNTALPPPRFNPNPYPNGVPPPPRHMEELRRALYAEHPPARRINLQHLIRDRAAHLWLALKLTVFVILFTGNGGWRRTLYLGSIAVIIFIWQTGIMNDIVRPLVEAIYPPPPGNNPQQQQQHPLNPANTAQLLINRQEDRMRDVIRNAERAVMIFMASLVPGWHDRHVNAIERQQEEVRSREQREREEREQRERAERERDDDEQMPQPAEARGAEVVEGVL